MNPERWKRVDQILQQAISRTPASLKSFLEEACAGDENLRREVESLIEHDQKAGSFIDSPAPGSIAADLAEELQPDFVGRTLLHYRILEKIGEGGMGVVYRAEDSHLNRSVAIKLLPPKKMTDPGRKKRFIQEAKAASALNHPNIITIYDISSTDGIDFIAMEYVAGKPLAQLIPDKGLPLQETLQYAIQISDALEKAHKAGIIHRDLKPSNIVVTEEGRVKILDFGLAKLVLPPREGQDGQAGSSESLTESGAIVGTTAYMSPEQAKGKPVDARSDIFSFGAVLYEMVTGRRAFKGDSNISTLAAVLHEDPEPISRIAGGLSQELGGIIDKALEKDQGSRYQSASDLLADLRRLQRDSESGRAAIEVPKPRWKKRQLAMLAFGTVLALGALLILLNVGGWRDRLLSRANTRHITSLAVLPLVNLSGDAAQDYFADGMTEALISDLGKIGALRVISRTSAMHFKGTQKSLPEIARELKVDAIIEGSVLRSGNRVRITANLIEGTTERRLWGKAYERDLHDILALQSDMASAIVHEIQVKLPPREQTRLAARRPVDPQAHELYVLGCYFLARRPVGLEKAIQYFEQAVAKDPQYAPAHAGLSLAYSGTSFFGPAREINPRAKASAQKALELDDTLSEAHAALGRVYTSYEWDWAAAERELKRAIELNPNSAVAHTLYGSFLTAMRRFDEAIAEYNRARDLDPISVGCYAALGWVYSAARRYDEAIAYYKKAVLLDPEHPPSSELAETYVFKGMYAEALKEYEKVGGPGDRPEMVYLYAVAGRRSEARAMLNRLERRWAREEHVDPNQAACAYAGLGDAERVCAWLNRAYEERDAELPWVLAKEPFYDHMRDAPCFQNLLRRMNFPW